MNGAWWCHHMRIIFTLQIIFTREHFFVFCMQRAHLSFNTSWPIDAYIHYYIKSYLVLLMACRLSGVTICWETRLISSIKSNINGCCDWTNIAQLSPTRAIKCLTVGCELWQLTATNLGELEIAQNLLPKQYKALEVEHITKQCGDSLAGIIWKQP